MNFSVDVRGDMKRALQDLQNVRSTVVEKATYRALNRALDRAATEGSREIRKEYNVKHGAVLAAMKKQRANAKRLAARLRVEGMRIPLIEFEARWRPGQPGGATVRIKVRGGRKTIRGAFIAKGKVLKRMQKSRFPLRALSSISIPQAFSNETVIEAVQKATTEAFVKAYEDQLRLLGGRNG